MRGSGERFRRRLDRLAFRWRVGAQRVLHAIAQLREHVRQMSTALRDENRCRRPSSGSGAPPVRCAGAAPGGAFREQKVGFVEEEDELQTSPDRRASAVFEQFAQHPQQERRIEPRRLDQLFGGENVHIALPSARVFMKSNKSSAGSPKKLSAPSFPAAAICARWPDGSRAHQTVFGRQFLSASRRGRQQGLQILQIQDQQTSSEAILNATASAPSCASESSSKRTKRRAHFLAGGADRVAALAVEVPKQWGRLRPHNRSCRFAWRDRRKGLPRRR